MNNLSRFELNSFETPNSLNLKCLERPTKSDLLLRKLRKESALCA